MSHSENPAARHVVRERAQVSLLTRRHRRSEIYGPQWHFMSSEEYQMIVLMTSFPASRMLLQLPLRTVSLTPDSP